MALAAAGHDRHPARLLRPVAENERVGVDPLANPRQQLLTRLCERAADADLCELRVDRDVELPREERVVTDLGMGVEREVIRRRA
jgi:hypothetical protein